jgi:hypothetical protein
MNFRPLVGTVVAGLLATITLSSCGSSDSAPNAAESSPSVDYSSVEKTDGPEFERVEMYRSIKELRNDSELVVVAEGTGEIRPDSANDEWTPLANTTVVVKQALFGTKANKGQRISVFVEGSRADDGTLQSSKIVGGKTYLLFLTRLHPDRPENDVYVITGYLAGQYEQVAHGKFGRVDGESTDLPIGLDVESATVTEVP